MATPSATPTLPRREPTGAFVSMVNQVTLEGYLVRAWIHEPYRYLRLANHRPPEQGGQIGGRVPVESDYVTVRLDPSVPFDMAEARPSLRILVRGRVEGRNIPETIGEILAHCQLHVGLPYQYASIQVSRPAVQICCTTLEIRYPPLPQAGPRVHKGECRNGSAQSAGMRSVPLEAKDQPSSLSQASSEPVEGSLPRSQDAAQAAVEFDLKRSASSSQTIPEDGDRGTREKVRKGRTRKK